MAEHKLKEVGPTVLRRSSRNVVFSFPPWAFLSFCFRYSVEGIRTLHRLCLGLWTLRNLFVSHLSSGVLLVFVELLLSRHRKLAGCFGLLWSGLYGSVCFICCWDTESHLWGRLWSMCLNLVPFGHTLKGNFTQFSAFWGYALVHFEVTSGHPQGWPDGYLLRTLKEMTTLSVEPQIERGGAIFL